MIAILLMLAGCGTLSRPTHVAADLAGQDSLAAVRFDAADPEAGRRWVGRIERADEDPSFDMLAISGGGANGAYGAGVLVGWSAAGTRPEFDIVTGISTGALTAPFAFLGPSWDGRLREAFAGPLASGILGDRNIWLNLPSLYSARPLERLVVTYVDMTLLKAVAEEHRRGRRLVVATTNLDTEQTIVWDMGAIALGDDAESLELFRDVLIASASIPAVFPPKRITVRWDERDIVEAHVDGGVAVPFIVAPEGLMSWAVSEGRPDRPASIYAIVNAKSDGAFAFTRGGLLTIATRSLVTMGKAQLRSQLFLSQNWARLNDTRFAYTTIPEAAVGDTLDFDLETRRALFAMGYNFALDGSAWRREIDLRP